MSPRVFPSLKPTLEGQLNTREGVELGYKGRIIEL